MDLSYRKDVDQLQSSYILALFFFFYFPPVTRTTSKKKKDWNGTCKQHLVWLVCRPKKKAKQKRSRCFTSPWAELEFQLLASAPWQYWVVASIRSAESPDRMLQPSSGRQCWRPPWRMAGPQVFPREVILLLRNSTVIYRVVGRVGAGRCAKLI